MKKAYSINDEEYRYLDADEALENLRDEDRLFVGATYYECDTKEVNISQYMNARRILEEAEERMGDDVGECGEDVFSVSKEAIEELERVLKTWADKYVKGAWWVCTGKTREVFVTEEDVRRME